jgi:Tol biopolymer transport system component
VTILGIDNGRLTRLEHPAHDTVVGWTPDGRHLLFASDRNTGSIGLYAAPLENGDIVSPSRLLDADFRSREVLRVTNSGALYYFGMNSPASFEVQAAFYDFNTGKLASAPRTVGGALGSNSAPVWSPDGESLAYLAQRSSPGTQIVVHSMETGESRRLIPKMGGMTNGILEWSPDGRSFLTYGFAPQAPRPGGGNDVGLFRVNVETGDATHFAGVQSSDPKWSPDGTKVYYRTGLGAAGSLASTAFHVRDLASGSERELIRGNLGDVQLSPDGRYIATFSRDQASSTISILLIPTDGGDARELMRESAATPIQPWIWAPDSRSIVILQGNLNTTPHSYWLVSLDGQKKELAADLDRLNASAAPRLSPDGRQIAFSVRTVARETGQAGVWVMENFLSKLR